MASEHLSGVLLVNLGTPDSPLTGSVRSFLREFLSDPRVLTRSVPMRWLLLNLVILPTYYFRGQNLCQKFLLGERVLQRPISPEYVILCSLNL